MPILLKTADKWLKNSYLFKNCKPLGMFSHERSHELLLFLLIIIDVVDNDVTKEPVLTLFQ